MNIWCAFPTASTQAANKTLKMWRDRGYKTVVFIDKGQEPPEAGLIIEDKYPGFPRAANALCKACVGQGADVVVVAGDDIFPDECDPQLIGAMLRERFPNYMGVMQPSGDKYGALSDSAEIRAAVSPWIGRKFITKSCAGPYFTGYQHLWADGELAAVASRMNCYFECPLVTQYHAHYTRGHPDHLAREKRQKISESAAHDKALFFARRELGFP